MTVLSVMSISLDRGLYQASPKLIKARTCSGIMCDFTGAREQVWPDARPNATNN